MKTIEWKPLKKGDIVDIVAPGMSTDKSVLKKAKDFLAQWGLVARYPKNIFGKDLLCANSQEKRLEFLKSAIFAEDSQAIWCVRGGYGSFHLLDDLKKIADKRRRSPMSKVFVGLSDGTSLHHFLQQQWGWATLHGSNIDRYAEGTAPAGEMSAIKKLLWGIDPTVTFSLKPLNQKAKAGRSIHARLQGGNLITCQATIGTVHQMETQGRILFFEDIGERGYRVDRCLKHFEMAGMLKGVRGIVFGDFVGGREPRGANLVPKVLKAFAESQRIPVFSGLPTGHGHRRMPLPLGALAHLSGGPQRGELVCQSGALICSN